MIAQDGQVKVMAFGISRSPISEVIGTAQYLSPELARGEPVDARSDVYAVGCVLFELLVGHPPFVGDSPVSIAYRHVREDPQAPSEINQMVSPGVDAIVLKALAKDPPNRYQSAQEMRSEVLRVVTGRQVLARPRPSPFDVSGTAPIARVQFAGRLVKPAKVRTLKSAQILDLVPRKRYEELRQDDVYTFDNSRSSSTATETIRVAHTAKVEIEVNLSEMKGIGGDAGVKFLNVASIQGHIKGEILARHSLRQSSEFVFEQATAISVPASTHVKVVFHWKRLWEEGMVTIGDGGVAVAQIPYAVTVGLRFDKETIDLH
jgi:serine/threonine protein kinase